MNNPSSQAIAAFFHNESDAEAAIRDLRDAGFRSDQIGCSCDDVMDSSRDVDTSDVDTSTDTRLSGEHHRSFWDKVENFFSGDERDQDRMSEAGGVGHTEASRSTFRIPDRYDDRLSSGGTLVTVHAAGRLAEAEQILTRNRGQIDREFAFDAYSPDYSASTSATTGDVRGQRLEGERLEGEGESRLSGDVTGERRIQLVSERLRVNKERVQSGEVRLRKEVRTERQNIEVPVTREELIIERVPTEGTRPANAEIGSDQEIRVPLSEERVNVEKTPVVREEVRVGKRAVEDTEQVSDETRHEELKVDDEKNVLDRKSPKRKIA